MGKEEDRKLYYKKYKKKTIPKFLFEGNFGKLGHKIIKLIFSLISKTSINSFHNLFNNPEISILILSPLINFYIRSKEAEAESERNCLKQEVNRSGTCSFRATSPIDADFP